MRGWLGWIAGGAAVALLITLAVVAAGFDARETPRADPAVWVERSSGQYARVNTETAEIDTVRVAESTSDLVQTAGTGVLLTQGFGRAWVIDPTRPQDVRDEQAAAGAIETPEGTRQVLAAGEKVLYLTESGDVFLASAEHPGETARLEGRADAVALDERGRVAGYSRSAGGVRWFDAATGRAGELEPVPAAAVREGMQLSVFGDDWVLFDPERSQLWWRGAERPITLDTVGDALLQASLARPPARTGILVADEAGLWSVDREGARRLVEASGAPARPEASGGEMVAAWIDGSGATLWTSGQGQRPLELDPSVTRFSDPQPAIRTNGDRAVVAELGTGMLWRVPDGRLIPVAQWNLLEPPKQSSGGAVTQDVTEQLPPVAVDDRFGVRAGEPALLPLLLNDYDPNRKDVLTVVADGLGDGLPAEFGEVGLLADAQGVMIRPSPEARGTVRFRYRVTDGVHLSAPATVALTVASDDENSGPKWCPVAECRRSWPSPEMTPGGTLVLPVLDGWVDPQGDPIALSGVRAIGSDQPVRALVADDGRLAIRHTDPKAAEGVLALRVTVSDARGASSERELRVRVRSGAVAELQPIASTVRVGEAAVLRPADRVTGGSGSFALTDAVVQTGSASGVTARVRPGTGVVEVNASRAGSSLLSVTIRDTVTRQELAGVIRIDAVENEQPLALPPLRAFVRPLADSTVDVLASVPSASTRSLSVRSATVVDGQVRADVIEHARIRVSGGTGNGRPGRIGAVDIVVAEGDATATGRMTVFQAPASSRGAIAVADTATVRAGSVVDIPALENDVSPPGDRLVLDPKVTGSGAKGELVFASGNRVRYLAPNAPGTYTLGYSASAAGDPDAADAAKIRVTVLPKGSNRAPQPAAVTVRVAPGERATATIPLSGVDPDGDRVRLVAVDPPENPQLTATIPARSGSVQIGASRSARPGVETVGYVVRDDFGGEARGALRVIITEPDPGGGAPVVYSDYVRVAVPSGGDETREPAIVRPLDNDIDPRGGTLHLVGVAPNVPGGRDSPEYREQMNRLDLARIEQGIVSVAASSKPGTVSFRYTVRSSSSTSTSDGLIVVQTSGRIGQQAPNVTDTVLSVRDRASLAGEGVDVVTGRVQWATGDVAELKLSLWGTASDRYRVRGNRIVGSYRAEGDLVPFRLSGADGTGNRVESYGFLIVPPLDELRLSLRPGAGPLTVAEGESIDVRIAELLDLGAGDRVELAPGSFTTQRRQAACAPTGAASVRYTAGRGGPWNDTCTIRVRLVEQRSYTVLPLPVEIVPDAPVAVLGPVTRTIAPGDSDVIELSDMLEWQGGREGRLSRLEWEVSGGGSAFDVSRAGAQLRVRAHADALSGAQQQVTVTVRGAGESSSVLTLRVGEAARDSPRGATIALSCTVGARCSAPLVGVPGEHDPFAGKPGGGLRVVSVDAAGCGLAALRADGDVLHVDWADGRAPGGSCTAGFTVRDAQHRTGTGVIELDALGLPRAPAAATTVGFTESSVTIRVDPGEARAAHPALQRVLLRQLDTGTTTTCSPSGSSYTCVVNGLGIGETHDFAAVAVNEVGESDQSPSVTAWAYRAPSAPTVNAEQLKEGTTEARGTVRFVISGQSDVRAYRIMLGGSSVATLNGREVDAKVELPVGAHSLTVVPVSRFGSPIDPSDNLGTATAPQPLTVAGLPKLGEPAYSYDPVTHTMTMTVNADENFGGALRYGAAEGEDCTANSNTNTVKFPLVAAEGDTVRVTVCAASKSGWGSSARTVDITIENTGPGDMP